MLLHQKRDRGGMASCSRSDRRAAVAPMAALAEQALAGDANEQSF
jgi:hypothetical protein